jgi:antitoxin component of MazEF toxin-antitoxin module
MMIKSVTKVGNSQGIIFDAALLDMARLKVGDQVDVVVHDGGTITLTPVRRAIGAEEASEAARKLIRKNNEVFRRLA